MMQCVHTEIGKEEKGCACGGLTASGEMLKKIGRSR